MSTNFRLIIFVILGSVVRRPELYVLDSHNVVPASLMEWAGMFEDHASRIVAQTYVGETRISTVFLGIDHNFSQTGPPLVFETMIFGGPQDGHTDRCSTWDEAVRMHEAAVSLVKVA